MTTSKARRDRPAVSADTSSPHLHFNAEALRRLVAWARTGEPTPMYTSARHRAFEIEAGAVLPAAQPRAEVHRSATALGADLNSLCAEPSGMRTW